MGDTAETVRARLDRTTAEATREYYAAGVWQATPELRWHTPKAVPVEGPWGGLILKNQRLQQQWRNAVNGKTEWRDVPTVVGESP